ncbi:MAG: BCCT family transporter, partial [Prevotella sp.]|nr:BCCT family transporter [Prevotella sp.]
MPQRKVSNGFGQVEKIIRHLMLRMQIVSGYLLKQVLKKSIIFITLVFIISAITGVYKGIKILSNFNTYLALAL